ncbi:MAG: hypothetical protein QF866_03180, partial [Arenicellales bacterium]|nr:hypothetical protein [Arenicellales bacterium]
SRSLWVRDSNSFRAMYLASAFSTLFGIQLSHFSNATSFLFGFGGVCGLGGGFGTPYSRQTFLTS